MKNLKQIFDTYQKKTKKSITQTSIDIGWSQSALGLYLTGARPMPRKDVVTAANFFAVDPRAIDSDFVFVDQVEVRVIGNISGNEPKSEFIKIHTGYNELNVLHIDRRLNIEAGPDCDMSEFMDGGFLPIGAVVAIKEPNSFWLKDENWPVANNRTWLLRNGEKWTALKNKSKPFLKNFEVVGYAISICYA